MSVIVGVVSKGVVWMGADSAITDDQYITAPVTKKIRKVGKMLIGYAGDPAAGQLAFYANYPPITHLTLEHYLSVEFVKAINDMRQYIGLTLTDESHAEYLIGIQGRLFEITTSGSVLEYQSIAIGSGYQYALGSLHTTIGQQPGNRIRQAIQAAVNCSPFCTEPIELMTI